MTVNTAEKYTSIGVDSLYIAKVTQDDADGYVTDTPIPLAPVGEIAGAPTQNSQTLYYDDQAYEEFQAEGITERTCRIPNLPPETYALLFGEEFQASTGRLYDTANPSKAPDFALGYRAAKSNGSYKYYWWPKGKFQKPSVEHVTKGETAEARPLELTFRARKTTHKFTLPSTAVDGVKKIVADEDTDNADVSDWFDAVQTPEVVAASALTCTPSPVDGATGVAVGANITLTFNNRIRTGSVGIILTSAAGAVIAAAYTWNAGGTLLTINPNSDLGAATDYLITLSGVTDIYNQVLANTVYNFQTA